MMPSCEYRAALILLRGGYILVDGKTKFTTLGCIAFADFAASNDMSDAEVDKAAATAYEAAKRGWKPGDDLVAERSR